MTMLPDGKFSVFFKTGEWRSIMIKTIVGAFGHKDSSMLGKRMVFYKKPDGKWQDFAFLAPDNKTVNFFMRVRSEWTQAQIESARKTIEVIDAHTEAARKLYQKLEGDTDNPKRRQRKLKFRKPTTATESRTPKKRRSQPSPHWPKRM